MLQVDDWSSALPCAAAALCFGYLLGSIPFGPVIAKAAGLGDIRKIGSGNIGATNMLRTGRKWLAAGTLVGDMLKGTVAVLIAGTFGPIAAAFAGAGAVIGHIFPVWLGFRGGKGVATYLGALIGLYLPAALLFAAVWLLIAWTLRFSSLSALVATLLVPPLLAVMDQWPAVIFSVAVALLIYWKHLPNIRRLARGEEPRIGAAR